MSEARDQWSAATRVILGMLQLQTEQPGAISAVDLPKMIHLAADERDRQGDYGAARLLDRWAEMMTHSLADWED